jgi:hypothetical protein
MRDYFNQNRFLKKLSQGGMCKAWSWMDPGVFLKVLGEILVRSNFLLAIIISR